MHVCYVIHHTGSEIAPRHSPGAREVKGTTCTKGASGSKTLTRVLREYTTKLTRRRSLPSEFSFGMT